MANILDYMDWRGDITFTKDKFNEIDGLILTQFAYVPFNGIIKSGVENAITVEQAVNTYMDTVIDDESQHTALMISCNQILRKMAVSERFRNLKVIDYVEKYDSVTSKQFGAVTFILDSGTAFVAYRGTDDTIAGWEEDFKLCYMTPVASQVEAAKYLTRSMEELPCRMYIGGHSKGGNLSVYAAMSMEDKYRSRIIKVLNYDGPGFLQYIVNGTEYKRIVNKVRSYMPQGSIVGMIMYHDEEQDVVMSSQKGFQQHAALSWQVLGKDFVMLKQFKKGSLIFNQACKKWVNEISVKEREDFIDIVFQILRASESDTISGITSELPKAINRIVKSYSGLDKTTKKMIKSTAGQMIKLSTKALSENKKHTSKNTKYLEIVLKD